MRFLHTADLHLGITLGGLSLIEEQEEMLQQLQQFVRREQLDGVLIAGDVFDRALAGADAIALYDRFLTALCTELHIPVFLIAGNHDGAARLTQFGTLLASNGLHLAGRLTERPTPIRCGDAQIFLIPFFHIEQVRLLYPDDPIPTMEAAMDRLMDDVRTQRDPTCVSIVVAHCFVTGASVAESDLSAQLGGAQQIGASVFREIDYVALGHLHRAQSPASNVHYAGTPYPYAFTEIDPSVSIYDTRSGSVSRMRLHPSHTLRTCRGAYDVLLEQAAHDAHPEDYIRIELTDRGAGLEALDAFRTAYPRLVSLVGAQQAHEIQDTLTVAQVRALSARELLCRFCQETGGYQPEEEEITRFLRALETAQQGGELQ